MRRKTISEIDVLPLFFLLSPILTLGQIPRQFINFLATFAKVLSLRIREAFSVRSFDTGVLRRVVFYFVSHSFAKPAKVVVFFGFFPRYVTIDLR